MNKKNNKKLLARIGAVLACVLLVGALAVPCFADPIINYDAPLKAYDYFKTQYLFNDANNFATQAVMNYWYNNNTSSYGNIGIFRAEELVAGTVDRYTQSRFYLPNGIEYDYRSSVDFNFDIEGAFSAHLLDSSGVVQRAVNFHGDGLNATLALLVTNYNDITLFVEFTDGGDYSLLVYYTCLYDDAEFICSPDEVFITNRDVEDWRYSFSSGVQLQVAFTPEPYKPYYEGSSPFTFFVASVIGLGMYYPSDYWVGWSNANSYFGGSQVYQDGYNEGYDKGYDVGYDDGVEYMDVDAYQVGYDAAVRDIDSGDFGKNLIGATLNTPLEALSNFNIVSWTTVNGKTINISIMTVLSGIIGLCLFVWFLRMFAGG